MRVSYSGFGWAMKKKKGADALGDADPRSQAPAAARAGCVQPHGAVFIVDPSTGSVRQASANTACVLGVPAAALIGESLDVLGGDLASHVRVRLRGGVAGEPDAFFATTRSHRGAGFGVAVLIHRNRDGAVVLEVVPSRLPDPVSDTRALPDRMASAIAQLGQSNRLDELSDAAAALYRELTGFDRVMLYRLPIAGAGEVVGESLAPGLDSWRGVGFRELDALGAAREEALLGRVRAIADVREPDVALIPATLEPTGNAPDLARAMLASGPPALRAHVRATGWRAAVLTAVVRDGEPWGFVAGYHREPVRVVPAVRVACDLFAELVATRIAVIDNFARAAASAAVRRFDEHLVARTLGGGLWQDVVLEDASDLLALAGADGMALFADGQVRRAGHAPPDAALRNLSRWVSSQPLVDGVLVCDSLPALAVEGTRSASPPAGVLVVSLSRPGGEFLMWFRGEAVRDIRAADAPDQPVRGVCKPWSTADVAAARAVANVLRDMSVQVRSLSYLVMGERLADLSRALQDSDDGVLIADGAGQVRFMNDALRRFQPFEPAALRHIEDLLSGFVDSDQAVDLRDAVLERRQSWQGELALAVEGAAGEPVAVRAEVIPRIDGFGVLGFIVLVTSLQSRQADEAARERAREALRIAQGPLMSLHSHPTLGLDRANLVDAVSASANLAVLEVAQQGPAVDVARTLEGLGASSRRAAELAQQVLALAGTLATPGADGPGK